MKKEPQAHKGQDDCDSSENRTQRKRTGCGADGVRVNEGQQCESRREIEVARCARSKLCKRAQSE